MKSFLEKLSLALAQLPLPEKAVCYGVAFSGGLDSSVLLAGLARLDHRPVRALHVNHGLCPESNQWEDHCRSVSVSLGIDFESLRVNIKPRPGRSLEAQARSIRYQALASMLQPSELLLTAHHVGDQLETVLLRLLRGSGVKGLRGIASLRRLGPHYVARPMLEITQSEIRSQAEAWGVVYVDDPSNLDLRFDRNYLRSSIVPQLLSRWPGSPATLGRAARQMVDAQLILDEVAKEEADNLDFLFRIPVKRILALPQTKQRNLVRYVLANLNLPLPNSRQLEMLLQGLAVERPDAMTQVQWPGGEARIYRNHLYLFSPLPAPSGPDYTGLIAANKPWKGPEGTLALERVEGKGLPSSWVNNGFTVSFRAGGERFRPAGARHSRSLKKLLQDAGVVPWMRSRIPLLFRDEEIVAVGDLWLGDQIGEYLEEPSWGVRWTDHPLFL
ncbi:MAG: tRNA lysidine(34) synthetase TilS [Pseudomonadota bacterium]|nr:tRNA lysidine(34) synthetase TilS [Pseudomonadota bacterium]